ncbi:Protein of unknown function DUF3435, partial [Penicillium capsulatum]
RVFNSRAYPVSLYPYLHPNKGTMSLATSLRWLSTTEPSDSLHPRDYENDTELSQTSDQSENPYSIANEAPNNSPERAEDPDTAKDTLATLKPSSPPTARS